MPVSDYDPIIEQASREWNVDPNLLRSVMQQESGGNPVDKSGRPIRSSAGAAGLMQIMPETQSGLGVSNPDDPYQSIYGGAKYLSQMLDRYQRPELAVAAYNAGPDRMDAHLANGTPLPAETGAYVPSVAANYAMFAKAKASPPPPSETLPSDADFLAQTTGQRGAAPVSGVQTMVIHPSAETPALPSDEDFLTATGAKAAAAPAATMAQPAPVSPVMGDPRVAQNALGGDQFIPNAAPNPLSSAYQTITNALAPPTGYTNSAIYPLSRNDATGAIGPGIPGWMRGLAQGATDLAFSPALGTVTPSATAALINVVPGLMASPAAGAGRAIADAYTARNLPPAPAASPVVAPNPLATPTALPAPSFVPPGAEVPILPRIQQLIEADNAMARTRPTEIPPNATDNPLNAERPYAPVAQPANPLSGGPATVPQANVVVHPPAPSPASTATAPEMIPNGLTPAQVAEFEHIPTELPPMSGQIRTPADAANRADQIINHFASIGNKTPIPGAEGSLPTITGNSGLATLYRAVRDSDTPVPFTTLESAGKAKIGQQLENLVGKPEDVDPDVAGSLANRLETETKPMRDAVFANKTETDPTPVIDTIHNILASPAGQRDAVVSSLGNVLTKLVDKDGEILPKATDPEQLYGVDKAIRDAMTPLAAGTKADGRLAASELMQVRDALRGAIEQGAPGFNDYMAKYAELAKPVTEMKYLQSRKLTNLQDETTLPKLQSMMDDIAKQQRANGIKPADSLSPDTLSKLEDIRQQLQREHFTATAGKALGSNTFQNLATNSITGRLAGHVGNALVGTGVGALTDMVAGGGGLTGAVVGNAISGVAKGYAEKQAVAAAARAETGRQMLMKELRDRLLNINNKGVQSLSGQP